MFYKHKEVYVMYYRKSGGGQVRVGSDDLERPLTRISRSRHFSKSNISKTARFTDAIIHNRKPYPIYRMTLIDLCPEFQGHDIF